MDMSLGRHRRKVQSQLGHGPPIQPPFVDTSFSICKMGTVSLPLREPIDRLRSNENRL